MTTKKNRKTYTTEFKAETLKLAELVDVAEVVCQLKLYKTQIYNRRNASERYLRPVNVKLNWLLRWLNYVVN
jgi:transposase-like protein